MRKSIGFFMLFSFLLFLFFISFAQQTSTSVQDVTCDNLNVGFETTCRIRGECYRGLLIVVGDIIPQVKMISTTSNSITFTPEKEGNIKIYAICFKPKIEIKKLVKIAKKQEISSLPSFQAALLSTIESQKNFIVKDLPSDKCYWIRPTFNGTHYLIEINVFKNDEMKCSGMPIAVENIVTKTFTNVLTSENCICGKNVLLENRNDGIRLRLGK